LSYKLNEKNTWNVNIYLSAIEANILKTLHSPYHEEQSALKQCYQHDALSDLLGLHLRNLEINVNSDIHYIFPKLGISEKDKITYCNIE
jgi:hypothetical protein